MSALALLLAAALPATVASPSADHVSLTVYRDPARQRWNVMNLRWLGGFALITETRTIHVPAGDATLRFEGVADGIIPASAIVTGLPGGVIEKNRDARLLSPASLVDGTLGRRVTLRRTDRATGKVSLEDAAIVAGPGQGVVLQTARGIEALRCSGLPEALLYDGVPAGLSAKPVLSVTTHSPQAADVTVTLSYLASGFDWSASYVATVAPNGASLDLFAWLTLANGNAQAWQRVDLQAVAGRLERARVQDIPAAAARLELHCHPLGTTTSDLPTAEREDIVVTSSRFEARTMVMQGLPPPPAPPPPPPPPEDLGDLKLYRVPEAVDVSPNGQKQVALLVQPRVAFERLYRFRFVSWQAAAARPATIALRLRNEAKAGLGIPLPAGTTTLYQPRGGTRLLLGTGTIGDTAKGGKALLTAGTSLQVLAEQSVTGTRHHLHVTNANPFAVPVEIAVGGTDERPYVAVTGAFERVDGVQTWRVTVPANGAATLDYSPATR